MIQDDFIIYSKNGLYCKAGDFYIDPVKPVHKAVITHPHADHAVRGNEEVYCTVPTSDIMKERYVQNAGKKFNLLGSNSEFEINGVHLRFLPAGHMLGSVQVLMEHHHIKYLYTGDFKLQDDSTCASFEFGEADVLITESTFAEPEHSHPDTKNEIEKLNSITQKGIIIGAYSIGKAQRLTQMIAEFCPQKEIFIHPSIYPFHKIYEQHQIRLGKWSAYSSRLFKQLKQCIYIVPPHVLRSFYGSQENYIAFATGWKRTHKGCNFTLNISDHADWNDVLEVVRKTKPKTILTLHGDGKPLQKYFSETEIKVRILN